MENIKNSFKANTPIFTNELLDYFMKKYSRARSFQLIKNLVDKKELVQYSKGIYYFSEGGYKMSISEIIEKKYLNDNGNKVGIYSGETLKYQLLNKKLNKNKIEVITNNETNIVRSLNINDNIVYLRKARCKINDENIAAYTLLELLSNNKLEKGEKLYNRVVGYINDNKINSKDIISLAGYFPHKTFKNLNDSGLMQILN